MLQHPNLEKWERRLKTVLDELNDFLEDEYGEEHKLHPRRAERDTCWSGTRMTQVYHAVLPPRMRT